MQHPTMQGFGAKLILLCFLETFVLN